MTEVLVGTKKGLFVLEGDPAAREEFELTARAFAGEPVEYAMRHPRTGRVLAAVTSAWHGPKIFVTDDPNGEWEQARGVELPAGADAALVRIWVIEAGEGDDPTLYAGGDPGVLFESHDGGARWEINRGLWDHPTRERWQPGGAGLCVHSIAPWPGDPDRLAVAVSAAGIWITEDRGQSWHRGNSGIVARYMPDKAQEATDDLCIHHIERAPRQPERLFMQFHGGVYRSDDAGESWHDIAAGLPADFGFPVAIDPADPDSAFVIPLSDASDRVTPEGRVRVYETRDAGASWTPRGDGLPQRNAYLTVLRQALDQASEGETLELYFGATSGDVFGTGDAGATWFTVASSLPPVSSVVAVG